MSSCCCFEPFINHYRMVEEEFNLYSPETQNKKLKICKYSCIGGTWCMCMIPPTAMSIHLSKLILFSPMTASLGKTALVSAIASAWWMGISTLGAISCAACLYEGCGCIPNQYAKPGLITCIACGIFSHFENFYHEHEI